MRSLRDQTRDTRGLAEHGARLLFGARAEVLTFRGVRGWVAWLRVEGASVPRSLTAPALLELLALARLVEWLAAWCAAGEAVAVRGAVELPCDQVARGVVLERERDATGTCDQVEGPAVELLGVELVEVEAGEA